MVDGRAIAFTGLEPTDYRDVGTFTLNLPAGDNVIDIAAGTLAGSGQPALVFTGTSGGVAFESAHVRNTTNVTIDTTAVEGDDRITISGADNDHGNTNLTILTGDGNDTVDIHGNIALPTNGTLTVDTRTINVATGVSVATTGAGDVNLTATRNIALESGSSITAVDGDITLSANQQEPPTTAGWSVGILLNGATVATSGAGSVSLTGRGGNSGTNNQGVRITGGSLVSSALGTVVVRGTGGPSTENSNHGVLLTGTDSMITSGGGAVLVEGVGGGAESTSRYNDGVAVAAGARITSAGSDAGATVTVRGTGGAGTGTHNQGVQVSGADSKITASGGAVLVEGTGGAGGGTSPGVRVADAGTITNAGTGAVPR
jgi:hypothetical protein